MIITNTGKITYYEIKALPAHIGGAFIKSGGMQSEIQPKDTKPFMHKRNINCDGSRMHFTVYV